MDLVHDMRRTFDSKTSHSTDINNTNNFGKKPGLAQGQVLADDVLRFRAQTIELEPRACITLFVNGNDPWLKGESLHGWAAKKLSGVVVGNACYTFNPFGPFTIQLVF